MERLKLIQLLAHTNKFNGPPGHALERERRAAAGVAIELG